MPAPRLFDPGQLFSIGLVWDVFVTLTGPLLFCAFAGWGLDRFFGTAPWLLLLSFPAALALVLFIVRRKSQTWYDDWRRGAPASAPPREKRRP